MVRQSESNLESFLSIIQRYKVFRNLSTYRRKSQRATKLFAFFLPQSSFHPPKLSEPKKQTLWATKQQGCYKLVILELMHKNARISLRNFANRTRSKQTTDNILWDISPLWLIDCNAVYLQLPVEKYICTINTVTWLAETVKAKQISFQFKKIQGGSCK